MNIFLSKLILLNFKGIRRQEIEFADVTTISGPNASGKTTINDAFTWLLFDKDSQGRANFEIKTLDENNQAYHRLDHEVTGIFLIDGVDTTLRKCFREKWTKPRGQKDEIFEGHETTYYWNDVPVKKSDYQAKVAALINENTFRMITSPLHFNQVMKWEERRAILVDIAGESNDQDLIARLARDNGATRYKMLQESLGKKTIKELKAQLSSEKKKIKEELEQIPTRISEANRSMPDPMDYDSLHEELNETQGDLMIVDEKLNSITGVEKAYQARLLELTKRKGEIDRKLYEMEADAQEGSRKASTERSKKIGEKESELSRLRSEYSELQKDLKKEKETLEKAEKFIDRLKKEWQEINAERFIVDESQFCCPTCKRAFDDVDVEAKKAELLANFNKNKSQDLENNAKEGKETADDITFLKTTIATLEAKMEAKKAEGERLNETIAAMIEENTRLTDQAGELAEKSVKESHEYKALLAEKEQIAQELQTPGSDNGRSELNIKRMALNGKISDLKAQLATQGQAEKIRARIAELEAQESTLAQKLADLEAQEFGVEEFVRAQMEEVERKVNGMFSMVRFKMFEEQINGGFSETCTALVNGVPFQDANTAAKIQAGLDVIKTLSKHYGVTAPIFIDNRESVLEIPEMDAQIIGLFVSGEHKKLTVEVGSAAMAR